MTQQEIEHFQLLSSLVLQVGDKKFILRDKELKNKYNINFEYLLELEECGLMSSQPLGLTLTSFREQPVYIHNSQIIGVIKGKEEMPQKIELSVFVFTKSGNQLLSAIHSKENSSYILDCLKSISKKHQEFIITAHDIKFIDDKDNINYNNEDILSSTSIVF